MHQYGRIICATSLEASPRVGKNMWGMIQPDVPYPDEIQPVNQAKKDFLLANQKPGFNSYTKNGKITKNEI